MISRMYFKCLSCDSKMIIRVQISHGLRQQLNFKCPCCESDSKLVLLLDNPPTVIISYNELDNIEELNEIISNDEDAYVLTLSTDFTIPEGSQNKEFYSPFLYRMDEILIDAFGENYPTAKIRGVGGVANIEELWRDLHRAYKFNKNKKIQERDKIINGEELSEVIFNFMHKYIGEERFFSQIENLGEFVRSIVKVNPFEFERLVKEQIIPKLDTRIESYIEIIDSFFDNYQDFKQMALQSRLSVETHKDIKVSSVNFKKIKMFYGEAFEVLGSSIDIIGLLNNIKKHNKYDKFSKETFSLQKYLTSDKASKMNCFQDNIELYGLFSKEFDNKLRNATHHKWLKFNDSTQKISYPSSGSGGSQINISYTEYLLKCNNILINIMFLFAIELIILTRFNFKLNAIEHN